jgi:hypothetical protein
MALGGKTPVLFTLSTTPAHLAALAVLSLTWQTMICTSHLLLATPATHYLTQQSGSTSARQIVLDCLTTHATIERLCL